MVPGKKTFKNCIKVTFSDNIRPGGHVVKIQNGGYGKQQCARYGMSVENIRIRHGHGSSFKPNMVRDITRHPIKMLFWSRHSNSVRNLFF